MTDDSTPRRSILSSQQLKEMRCLEENPRDEAWTSHDRHFFIITDAARPVYCRYGNEVNITPLLCTIVTFTGQLVRDGKQTLKKVVAGDKILVFYLPLPFIFVAVSSAKVPESLLLKELLVLEYVIFSILTPAIAETLKRRPNFDIKKQTSGAERMFTTVLHFMDHAHSFIFHDCVSMACVTDERKKLAQAICAKRAKSVLAVVLFYHTDLFFIAESASFHLTADDILILVNNTCLVLDSFENTWTPIWLPMHEQMLHILTLPIESNRFTFKTIFITNMIDTVADCAKMAEEIGREIPKDYDALKFVMLPQIDRIRHWLIADRTVYRLYTPFMEGDVSDIIYRNYAWVYEYLKNGTINANGRFYIATEEITIFGRHTQTETIFAAADAGCRADQAQVLFDLLSDALDDVRSALFQPWPLLTE
jgi:hypothetical protein